MFCFVCIRGLHKIFNSCDILYLSPYFQRYQNEASVQWNLIKYVVWCHLLIMSSHKYLLGPTMCGLIARRGLTRRRSFRPQNTLWGRWITYTRDVNSHGVALIFCCFAGYLRINIFQSLHFRTFRTFEASYLILSFLLILLHDSPWLSSFPFPWFIELWLSGFLL